MRRRPLRVVATAGILGSVLWVPATAQAQPSATGPSYGDVSSAVIPQPDGAPSVFIQAGGIVYNSWYANRGWSTYRIAAYTPPMDPPPGSLPYGPATSRAVAVLQPDGSPSIFFQGVGGTLWNYWYVNGTWDSAEIASSGVQSTPVAILQPNGSPSVFVAGPENSLLNYWYIPNQGIWGKGTVAGAGAAFSAPAAVADPASGGAPWVFVEGPSHSLVWYSYCSTPCGAFPSGSWFSQPVATFGEYVLAFSAPGVVVQPDGSVSVFVVGPDNSLVNYYGPTPSSMTFTPECLATPTSGAACWNSATVAGDGSAYSTPAVTLQADGAPSAFVLGPSGTLLNYWYVPSQPGWGAGTVEPPGASTSQVFGVLIQNDGTPQAFSAHQDGSLWYSSYAHGSWNNVEWGVNDAPVETYTDSP